MNVIAYGGLGWYGRCVESQMNTYIIWNCYSLFSLLYSSTIFDG